MKMSFLLYLSLLASTNAFTMAPLATNKRMNIGHHCRQSPLLFPSLLVSTTRTTRPVLHSLAMNNNNEKMMRRTLHSLSMTSNNETVSESSNSNDVAMQKKVEGRKLRVVMGNRIASVGYLAWFLVYLVKSLQSTNYNIFTTISSIDPGPLLASGFAYILISACQNNRLSSDTYKRLNLNLVLYSLLGLVNQARGDFVWNGVCAVTCINSIKGYGYGFKGWTLRDKRNSDAIQDVWNGTVANVKSLLKISNERSVGYLLATVFVGVLGVAALLQQGVSTISSCASLLLLATATFTLKDAADRDRLQGTTFIELNFLAATVFAQVSVFLSSRAKAPWAVASGAFAVFSALVGASSLWKKKKQIANS